jgi:hypothetical protein
MPGNTNFIFSSRATESGERVEGLSIRGFSKDLTDFRGSQINLDSPQRYRGRSFDATHSYPVTPYLVAPVRYVCTVVMVFVLEVRVLRWEPPSNSWKSGIWYVRCTGCVGKLLRCYEDVLPIGLFWIRNGSDTFRGALGFQNVYRSKV